MKKFTLFSLVIMILLTCTIPAYAADSQDANRELSHETSIVETALSESANDLRYFGNNPIADTLLLTLSEDLRQMKANGATEEELLDFYYQTVNNPKVRYDLDGYITGMLNSQEQTLYNNNPVNGLLCMANGKLALGYAEDNYNSNVLHNGNGDAFRHVLWNYGMCIDVGYSFAKSWSDAHEDGGSGPALEKQMDKYNNAIGLQLGQDNPLTILHSTFISKSKAKVHDGYCKIISGTSLVWSGAYGEK